MSDRSEPATKEQNNYIESCLLKYPELGSGVQRQVKSISSYDGASAIRYINFIIAGRQLARTRV